MIETPLLKLALKHELSPKYLLVVVEIGLGLLCGLGFLSLGIGGGAWILGGIVAGAIAFVGYRWLTQATLQPNRDARKVGQILVGLTVGFSIHHNSFSNLSLQLPILVAIALFLLLNGSLIGYLYSKIETIDRLTALLATVPGNIGVMASIAADYNRNPALVSLVQLIRFTSIILVVPLIANLPSTHNLETAISELIHPSMPITPSYFMLVGLVLGIATLSAILGSRHKIPVAAFICPIIVGLIVSWTLPSLPWIGQETLSLPPILKVMGQILLGTTIGEFWAVNPRLSKATMLRSFLPVAMTMVVSLLTAVMTRSFTHWDWLTCLLVAAPGGSPEMIWIALALDHHVEIVTVSHVVRLLTINLALPFLITFVVSGERRLTNLSLSQDDKNLLQPSLAIATSSQAPSSLYQMCKSP